MKELELNITVDANKESTWDLLFNRFGEVSNFNPLINQSHDFNDVEGVGCERQCNFDPEGKKFVRERITKKWNDGFHIDIFQGGLPMMKELSADVNLKALKSGRTEVKFTLFYQTKPAFLGGLMKPMMRKQFKPVLIGMKYHLETGGLVDDKNIDSIIRLYKKGNGNEAFRFNPKLTFAKA